MSAHLVGCLSSTHMQYSQAEKLNEHRHTLFDELMETYDSGARRDTQSRRRETASAAVTAWGQAFGDPSDPRIAAKIDATADGLLALAAA